MTTTAEALAVFRSRLEALFPPGSALDLRWPNEGPPIPDAGGKAFAFSELVTDPAAIVAFGGGRGQNLQRTTGFFASYIHVPRGSGTADALAHAEAIAANFGGYRDDKISCFAAEAVPQTGKTDSGNYDHVATALIEFHYDKQR